MVRIPILEWPPYSLVYNLKMDEVGCYETSIPVYREEGVTSESTANMIPNTAMVGLYRHNTAFREYDIQIHT